MKTLTLSLALLGAVALPVQAEDFILAPAKPDKLVVVNADKMAIEKVIELGRENGPMPYVPVVAPGGQLAYVTVNKSESILKVDLISGEVLGRIDMSSPTERVKGLFGLALSPDGKVLASFQSPVKLAPSHLEVQPTRIALYDAETLAPTLTFPVPRQVTLVMFSRDGSKIFAMGRAMHVFDAKTGAQIDEYPMHSWEAETYLQPDVLDVWSQHESSGVMVTPFYTARKDMELTNPEAFRTGMLTLDLDSGQMDMREVRIMDVFYFSTAASPDKTRAYGAYNVLESFDLVKNTALKRVSLPHSYYSVNVSTDGKTVWLGGAASDLAAYDAETLERKGSIELPGGASMSLASVRLFTRDE